MTPDFTQLFALTNEYRSLKYDLRNIQVLLQHLGNPQDTFRSILIAGTNGKGSVAAFLSAMMPEAGLYTSPHLVRLNERIRIGTDEISDVDIQDVHDEVVRAADQAKDLLYPPTYFEIVTAMAFTYFRGRVTTAVLEVGLGGRLDATNVVHQALSVITNISYDHQEFLGSTLTQIATEKAGIIKNDEPVVVGQGAEWGPICERAGNRLLTTGNIARTARPLDYGCFEIDIVTPIRRYSSLKPRLAGRHQLDNVVVAIRAAECLDLPKESIDSGIQTAVWPGRLERIPGRPSFLLDGAHNQDGARALAGHLEEFYPGGVVMIFGCMTDKNIPEMLKLLEPWVRRAIFTRVQNSRSEDPVKLKEMMPESRAAQSLREAIEYARQDASPDDTVLICGSLYLIGEARGVLQL